MEVNLSNVSVRYSIRDEKTSTLFLYLLDGEAFQSRENRKGYRGKPFVDCNQEFCFLSTISRRLRLFRVPRALWKVYLLCLRFFLFLIGASINFLEYSTLLE